MSRIIPFICAVLCVALSASAAAQTPEHAEATPTQAAPLEAIPPVDVSAVAKALLDQGSVGFIPGNIRVVAEAGTKAKDALAQLSAKTGSRAYLVLCARDTPIAPIRSDLARLLGLRSRDVLVISTAKEWAVFADAAEPAALRALEKRAADPRGGTAFDRLEELLRDLPAAMDAAFALPGTLTPTQAGRPLAPHHGKGDSEIEDKRLWLTLGIVLGSLAVLLALAVGYQLGSRSGRGDQGVRY